MAIHHSQIKKAEKAGYTLHEQGDMVRAFAPSKGLQVFGVSASDAMQQMQAAMVLHDEYRFRTALHPEDRLVIVTRREDGHVLQGGETTPHSAFEAIRNGTAVFEDPTPYTSELTGDEREELEHDDIRLDGGSGDTDQHVHTVSDIAGVARSANGVALDGAIAFKEGTPAGDCPYSSEESDDDGVEGDEYTEFLRWNDEWDAAADAAQDEADSKGGSVVSEKYRAKYAEMGHPTHCGDWLAETMNTICLNKAGTNLELFEEICALNGVNTSKYRRDGVGWQGRIRMTGRNLLAKRVFEADGVLKLPETINGGEMKAPAEWMAQQRYKRAKKES